MQIEMHDQTETHDESTKPVAPGTSCSGHDDCYLKSFSFIPIPLFD